MKLDYYLMRCKVKQKQFAKIVGMIPAQISNLVRKAYEPTLFNALKIHYGSGKKVRLEDMLTEEHLHELYTRFGEKFPDDEECEKK